MHYYDPWFSNDLYYELPTYYRIPPPPPPTYYNRHPFYNNNPPPYLPPPPPIPRRNLSMFSSVMYGGTTNRGGLGDWSAGAGGGGVNEEFRQRGNTVYVVRKRLRQKGKLIKKRYKPKRTGTAGRSCVGPPGNTNQDSVNSYSSRHSKDDDDEEEEYEDSEYEEDEDDEEEEEEEYEVPYGTVDSSGRIHKLPTTSTN